MVTEARQTDRCNIWTICSYKHITFGVSLSLSLTAGLFYLAWPAANGVYSCQMPYTHPNTCQHFSSILIHPHSRSLFCFFIFFCRIKYLTSAASRLLRMFLDLYRSKRFFAESHIGNVVAWLFRGAQSQWNISKHVKMCCINWILACFATVFHSQCVCACAEPRDVFFPVNWHVFS